jgi:DNA primase
MKKVEDLLIERGIYSKSSGSNNSLIHCLSPEHDDEHPSLSVNMTTGQMHCFSCGFNGNIYSHFKIFIDKGDIKLNEFIDKLYELKSSNGIEMPPDVKPFTQSFRNISSNTYRDFLAFTSMMFENRICFPLYDSFGKLQVIHTRHLFSDAHPKYVTYPAGVKIPFYPRTIPNEYKTLVLVEGFFDMLNLYDNGVKNVICTFGSSVSKTWYNRLQHYLLNIQKVIILFDGDLAGRRGATDISRILDSKYIINTIIPLEEGKDPGSMEKSEIDKLKAEIIV